MIETDTVVPFHSQQASQELTEVFNQLWHLDTNRLRPGTDYIISLQVSAHNLSSSWPLCNAEHSSVDTCSTKQQIKVKSLSNVNKSCYFHFRLYFNNLKCNIYVHIIMHCQSIYILHASCNVNRHVYMHVIQIYLLDSLQYFWCCFALLVPLTTNRTVDLHTLFYDVGHSVLNIL